MIKTFKILGAIIIAAFVAFGIKLWIVDEPLPRGKEGPAAEELTDKMLNALNQGAYDSLKSIAWDFPRGHSFAWDKVKEQVTVSWSGYEVSLDTETLNGKATYEGELLEGEEKKEALQKAWKYFANDSFWLVAPYKVRDRGTTRAVVATDEGPGLLVTYSSGGVTPGDSYLWILNENFRPKAWKMWVQMIPVGGVEFSWEDWTQYEGAWFASVHEGPFGFNVDLKIKQVE